MSTSLTGAALKEAVIETYIELKGRRADVKMARKDFSKKLEQNNVWRRLNGLEIEIQKAREDLKEEIKKDPILSEAKAELSTSEQMRDAAQMTLSDLLVKQTMLSKNRSVDVGDKHPHSVILTARIGQEAPEQLPLFDEE